VLPIPIRRSAVLWLLSLSVLTAPAVSIPSEGPASRTPHAHASGVPPDAANLPPLSLSTAVRRTLERSPELAILPFPLRAQAARIEAAGLRPVPEVGAQLENVLGNGSRHWGNAGEVTFALSQVIELGGQRQRRIEAAQGARDLLETNQAITQLDVLAEVSRRFIHVASDQKQLELTALATRLAEKTLAEVRRRVDAAHSPVAELHRARIVLARAEVEHEHAEHELLTSRRKLAAMWGENKARDFGAVQADLFRLPEMGDYEVLVTQLAASPDFLRFATEARQRDAELRLAEAKSRANPTVSAGLRLFRDKNDATFVAGVSMPLFTKRQAQPAIAEARAQRESLAAERHAAQVKAEASLYELVQELRHSITEAEMLRDRVLPEMEKALAATEYAWERGRYSYLEWMEAQREHIAVQRALIEAAANVHLYRVEIERLTGAAAGQDSGTWSEGDHRHSGEAQGHTHHVSDTGTDAIHRPQPQQGGADVDTTIGGVDAPAGLRMQREQPHKRRETGSDWQEQPDAAALLEPQPGQIAAEDFGQRSQSE
jgi:outer membrane protein, heavy metal efflux system